MSSNKRGNLQLFIIFALAAPVLVFAQTVYLEPQYLEVQRNTNFSLPLTIDSVTNLFGVNFNLNYNSSLISYINSTEGNFLNQGCQTSMMITENPVGKIIFGITRLGASCGGVSGSGTIATLNFKSLNQDGIADTSFSNNSLCILNGTNCDYVTGTWVPATITVGDVVSVSIVSDGSIDYGVMPLNSWKSTLPDNLNDWQVVRNNGNTNVSFNIKGQNTACPWILSSNQGSEQYVHQFCNATDYNCSTPPANYISLTTDYQNLKTNVSANGVVDFHLRLGTPTATECYVPQSVDVTIQAVKL